MQSFLGLSNDSSMTSLTTASLSNRSGERERGFHLRTVETTALSHCTRRENQVYTSLLIEGNMQQLRPLKIKKSKNFRFLFIFGFWRAEMVLWRKRSPSTNVAWVRFRTPSPIWHRACGFYNPHREGIFPFFSPGIPLFPSLRTNDI